MGNKILRGSTAEDPYEDVAAEVNAHDPADPTLAIAWQGISKLPPKIFEFASLHTLYLDGNKLARLPEEFARLDRLENFSVAGNLLGEDPTSLLHLPPSITSLDVSGNQLRALPDDLALRLPRLREFKCNGNALASVPSLATLKDLTLLSFAYNSLEGTFRGESLLPPSLATLELISNNLTDVAFFSDNDDDDSNTLKASSLTHLDLRENLLTRFPDETLRFTRLEVLLLASNQIARVPNGLASSLCNRLRHLGLEFNDLDSIPDELITLAEIASATRNLSNSNDEENGDDDDDDRKQSSPLTIDVRGNAFVLDLQENDTDEIIIDKKLKNKHATHKEEGEEDKENNKEESESDQLIAQVEAKDLPNVFFRCALASHYSVHVPDEIVPKLYLGGFESARNKHVLKHRLGITHILSVAPIKPLYPQHFKYMRIDVDDDDHVDLHSHFEKSIEFIEEGLSSGAVLVHCRAGVSRSATVTLAYLMKTKRMKFDDAFSFVQERRSCICPNNGFRLQLRKWERHLKL